MTREQREQQKLEECALVMAVKHTGWRNSVWAAGFVAAARYFDGAAELEEQQKLVAQERAERLDRECDALSNTIDDLRHELASRNEAGIPSC